MEKFSHELFLKIWIESRHRGKIHFVPRLPAPSAVLNIFLLVNQDLLTSGLPPGTLFLINFLGNDSEITLFSQVETSFRKFPAIYHRSLAVWVHCFFFKLARSLRALSPSKCLPLHVETCCLDFIFLQKSMAPLRPRVGV